MGGLAGADSICRARANAAGLPGNYVAWLSTSTVDAIDRLGNARGWVRPDGRMFVDSKADLAGGVIIAPPRLDEFGVDTAGNYLWAHTATTVDGTLATNSGTCAAFTSTTDPNNNNITGGLPEAGSQMFTNFGSTSCSQARAIYCFGVDQVRSLTPPQDTGRMAFVTQGRFSSGGGIAAADTMCNTEASQAGLPGNYRALLADVGATAQSRFDTNGTPWVRPDGPAIMPTAAALFSGAPFDVALNVGANGQTHYGNSGRWSGGPTVTTVGTDATTCNGWTASTASSTGGGGRTGATDLFYMFGVDSNVRCDATWMKLACLQQ